MAGKEYSVDLSAPRCSDLRLSQLLSVLHRPAARAVTNQLLADPIADQGRIEHRSESFEHSGPPEAVKHALYLLRKAGWIHQRPGRSGLLTRLRSDDLDERFPGVLRLLEPRVNGVRARRWVEEDSADERREFDAAIRKLLDR